MNETRRPRVRTSRLVRLLLAAVTTVVVAFPSAAYAQGPMIEVDLDCEAPIGEITVSTNPVFLWVPGHVTSDSGYRTHIVTSIFGFEKGNTNAVLDTVECTVVGAPFDGLSVWGFFVP